MDARACRSDDVQGQHRQPVVVEPNEPNEPTLSAWFDELVLFVDHRSTTLLTLSSSAELGVLVLFW